MKNTYRNYTPEEIAQIFKEENRICCVLDFEACEYTEREDEITIRNWRDDSNLVPWEKLYPFLNIEFNINLSWKEWMKAVMPEKEKTLWDLCVFISKHAKKEIIKPIRRFGKDCLGAAIFFTLKQNLSKRGVNVEGIRPSTPIITNPGDDFNYMMVEIIKTGAKPFKSLKLRYKEGISFWQKINIFNPDRYYVNTGSINTFRDLTIKMAEDIKTAC